MARRAWLVNEGQGRVHFSGSDSPHAERREPAGHRLNALVEEGEPVRFPAPSADEASTQGLEELLGLPDLPPASQHQVNQVVERVFGITEAGKVALTVTLEGGQDAVDVEQVWFPWWGVGGNPLFDPGILHRAATGTVYVVFENH